MTRLALPSLRRLRRWRSRLDIRNPGRVDQGSSRGPRHPASRSARKTSARSSPSRAMRSAGATGGPATCRRRPVSVTSAMRASRGLLELLHRRQRRRLVGVGRQPGRHLERDGRRADRVVAQDACGQALVGDDQPRVGARAQPRIGQRDVLDGARLALEGHEVADAQRLGDGEDHAGDGVGQHLARGEADDGGGDRARGEHGRGQAVQARELREGQGAADHDDGRLDGAAQEAQARVEHRADLGAAQRIGQLVRAPAHDAVHDRDERERCEERQCGGDQAPRRRVGCDDEGRHGA